ncbi:ADP-ribosylation factor 9 [Micractinium conductrix]|uniref:ADP-ribosylation factor 9 n=1 Tax=Micractinium conductrix TaxID=554055 RepID=A0A2P6VLT7_9CHLO|nr:ADP-ribosylation factor 9 [Micractinium conductrix]|eukprot:PSC75017.1 ADP-ribosylation factor 9 [Micractinium conductrix]
MEAANGPDFSHLPSDALHHVFEQLLKPGTGDGTGLPLSEFVTRYATVRQTCKHWSEVLLAAPPLLHLDVSVMPESWLPWLASLPLATLRIDDRLDVAWSPPGEDKQQHGRQQRAGGPPAGMPAPLTARHLVQGLEGAGLPRPFWLLLPFWRLQALHLQAPVSSAATPAVFDGACLEGLSQLQRLSLGSFADFKLQQLPGSLRRLRLCYDAQNRTLSVPELPPHISLDLLRVEKAGALGIPLDDLATRVAAVEAHAAEVLLGVAVEDRQLIRTFERPYREGSFVPPHIWGDEEADDKSKDAAAMTANHFLVRLPSAGRLQRLSVRGGAAHSLKFMPVAPGGVASSLNWLWSVVRLQGMHQMYGLSGEEMDERQQLFYDRLRFTLAPGACDIEVVKPQQALAPAGAW